MNDSEPNAKMSPPEPTGGTLVKQHEYYTDDQIEQRRMRRRREVTRLYLQGHRQADIAVALGIGQSTVSEDLAWCRQQWEWDRQRDAKALVAKELARLDNLESRYWAAWEKSGGKLVRVTVEKGSVDGKPTERRIEVTEDSPGDPRFLAGVLECIRMRCKLLGLEAPKQSVVTVVPVKVVAGLDLDAV